MTDSEKLEMLKMAISVLFEMVAGGCADSAAKRIKFDNGGHIDTTITITKDEEIRIMVGKEFTPEVK